MTECRAITLINYHIPMSDEIEYENVQYITLGFFDGMITKKIQLEELDQKKLWQYELHRTAEGKGGYSYQNIACIVCDTRCDCTDEELWNEDADKKYPLTFVTFLQLEDYASDVDGINKLCLNFNAQVKKVIQNGMCYTYKTVDKNDFVVCIKCVEYKKAVKAIKMLHLINDGKIVYSYTVFSILKKVLSSLEYDDFPQIFHETIDSICLKGIVNSSCQDSKSALDHKYRKYGETLLDRLYQNDTSTNKRDARIYDILGDNDFRLIARQVNLGKILREFCEDGLLNYQNNIFRENLFSSSLVLNTDVNETSIISGSNEDVATHTDKKYTTPYCDKLEQSMVWISNMINTMKKSQFVNQSLPVESDRDILAAMCNGIWQLLQSLKALERPKTKKYDFWTIYIPLRQMVVILEDKAKSKKIDLVLKNRARVYDFLHKISMTLHGTLRTDIQFFQIRDFNAVIHYAPAKLRAFYSLWALRLSEYYSLFCENNTGKTYSFILSPGMFSEMSVEQLFDYDEEHLFDYDEERHRLMLITMPERQLYILQNTCIMLGHEVSHFVGTDVKCRDGRYFCLLNICAQILALEINSFRYHHSCSRNHPRELEIELEKLIAESELYERIRQLLLQENAVLEKRKPSNKELHSEITISRLQSLFDSFNETCFEMVLGENCEYYFQSYIKNHLKECTQFEDKKKLIHLAKEISYDMDEKIKLMNRRFTGNLDSFLGRILYEVLREACADVSSILTLELTPAEYLDSFSDSKMPDQEEGGNTDMISEKEIRISLVITSIQQGIVEYRECFLNQDVFKEWTMFGIASFVENCPSGSKCEVLGCKVYMCMEALENNSSIRHYESAYNTERGCFTGEVLNFYVDSVVWNEMNQYIVLCVKEYLQQLSSHENIKSEKDFLTKTYKRILKQPIGMQIQTLESFLKKSEKEYKEKY